MFKKLFFLSIGLWVLTAGIFGAFFIKGSTSQSTDNRRAIHLSSSEKDIVLGEMRQVLASLNGVLRLISEEKFKEAAISAKKAGAGMAVDINPVLMAKLPLEFKELGMSMHKDFDVLSKDLDSGLSLKDTTQRLGAITNKCIACHSTYRLNDK